MRMVASAWLRRGFFEIGTGGDFFRGAGAMSQS